MSKYLYSLGLMSGTSMDGIDLSIIKSDGEQFVEVIDDLYHKYNTNNDKDMCEINHHDTTQHKNSILHVVLLHLYLYILNENFFVLHYHQQTKILISLYDLEQGICNHRIDDL